MNIAVRYYSKTGNTKKLAEAIGKEVGVEIATIETPITERTDILFLGSSVYAAGVDDSVKNFINHLDGKKVKKVVNFSTAALLPSTYKQVQKLLEIKGIPLEQQEYHCRRSFGFFHKGMPNQRNISEAMSFARKIINES